MRVVVVCPLLNLAFWLLLRDSRFTGYDWGNFVPLLSLHPSQEKKVLQHPSPPPEAWAHPEAPHYAVTPWNIVPSYASPCAPQSTAVFPPIHCSQYCELLSICQNPTQSRSSSFLQDLVVLSIILAWNVSHVQAHCLTRDHFCYLCILIDDKVLECRACLLLWCLSTLYRQG